MTRSVVLVLAVVMAGGVLSCAADMPVAPELVGKGVVNGIVLDRDGNPLDQVRVIFGQTPATQPTPYVQTQTRADGTFELELEAGSYRVQLWPHTHREYPQADMSFTVKAGESRFEYRYAGVFVSGTAIGPGGVAIPGVFVAAYGDNGYFSTSGQNGSYRILLDPGEYSFQAYAGSVPLNLPRLEFQATVSPQDTTIDLDFSGHELTIDVTLFGLPLPGAYITAYRSGVSAAAETDALGTAVIYLPTGTYDFRVNAGITGITGPERRAVGVAASGPIHFALGGARWTTTVRRAGDQSPVALANVNVIEIGSDRQGSTSTDQTGRFQMVVQPDVLHSVWIRPLGSNNSYLANGIASSADSTFDLLVDIPAP
ncbi:MAG TPA: hypothetical protein VFP58_02550 [Candidatus Eisenbacteria bacterium]|nr:hypothetical protein [Candidatus Eisenbacteria bacterium]